jgi:hypothetical protein
LPFVSWHGCLYWEDLALQAITWVVLFSVVLFEEEGSACAKFGGILSDTSFVHYIIVFVIAITFCSDDFC